MTVWHNSQIRLQELMVFQAIFSSQSITAASETLDLTQSGVSKRLKFLRSYFDDELFIRTGNGMVATSKALMLAPKISALINDFESLQGENNFSSWDIERDFVISTTDDVQHFLLPKLIERIEAESPKSRITFRAMERDYAVKELESGGVDLVIAPNWNIPEHLKQRRLYTDDMICIHRKEYSSSSKIMTLDNYLSARHMMISPLGKSSGPIDEILNLNGHKRFIALSSPYFIEAADALLNSDLLLAIQRRPGMELAKRHSLKISELPIKVNPITYFLIWHKRYNKDSSNCWLRKIIYEILHSDARPPSIKIKR